MKFWKVLLICGLVGGLFGSFMPNTIMSLIVGGLAAGLIYVYIERVE